MRCRASCDGVFPAKAHGAHRVALGEVQREKGVASLRATTAGHEGEEDCIVVRCSSFVEAVEVCISWEATTDGLVTVLKLEGRTAGRGRGVALRHETRVEEVGVLSEHGGVCRAGV